MQDALLCYYMLLNMRHAGHFLVVADLFRRAVTRLPLRRLAASLRRRGTWSAVGRGAAVSAFQEDWIARLMRLENYVAART
jgi:hypothetical protein